MHPAFRHFPIAYDAAVRALTSPQFEALLKLLGFVLALVTLMALL